MQVPNYILEFKNYLKTQILVKINNHELSFILAFCGLANFKMLFIFSKNMFSHSTFSFQHDAKHVY